MKNTTFFKQQSSNILFHSVYVLIYAGAIVLHSVAYPIPFLMLLLQFTMLASEEVNVRLFLIYPMVDSAHGEASGFFGVFLCVWKYFRRFSSKSTNEVLWAHQTGVDGKLNSYKKENIAFGKAESFIRSLSSLVFCSVIWRSQYLERLKHEHQNYEHLYWNSYLLQLIP